MERGPPYDNRQKVAKTCQTHVENHGEKAVEKAIQDMVDLQEMVDLGDDYADMTRLSHELYPYVYQGMLWRVVFWH